MVELSTEERETVAAWREWADYAVARKADVMRLSALPSLSGDDRYGDAVKGLVRAGEGVTELLAILDRLLAEPVSQAPEEGRGVEVAGVFYDERAWLIDLDDTLRKVAAHGSGRWPESEQTSPQDLAAAAICRWPNPDRLAPSPDGGSTP